MISLNKFIQHLEGEFTTLPDIKITFSSTIEILLSSNLPIACTIYRQSHLSHEIFKERAARIGFNLLAPLADRLGMGYTKLLFEDYSFEAVNPTYHKMLKQQCVEAYVREEVNSLTDELQQAITTSIQNAEVRWQFDSLYTMYRRQLEHNFKLGKPLHTVPITSEACRCRLTSSCDF